jgi:hypothetical protein
MKQGWDGMILHITSSIKKRRPNNMKETIKTPAMLSPADIVERIYTLVAEDKLKYVEAILEVCEECGIEPEDIVPLIQNTSLKYKIENEAMKNNVIPNTQGTGTLW